MSERTPHLAVADIPAAVERELEVFFQENAAKINQIGAPVAEAVGHLRDFVLGGGKRIRPTYGWVGYAASAGKNCAESPNAVLRAVSALELIQACALIHDDIIDASDTRRGKPTVHRAISAEHAKRSWHGDSDTFGENVAILIGDLALAWADDIWRYSGVSDEALKRAAEPWRGMRAEVIGGQILDIALEASGSESVELADSVNRYKTAAYTVERPLHLGAALAGAGEETIAALRGYGRDIGIAFQLRDDLLGVFGDPAITGKPAGDDLREGKRTVLYALALRAADDSDPAAAKKLRTGIGTATDADDIAELARIIETTGAVDVTEDRITRLTESGLKHLESADFTADAVETLTALAIKSTARRK
ncbi:polyprenyl synthetase family protein [Corynebacterium appendicis]|uniref:polyprenyl synthetase family protein n=1 Tax=Corynebacterium appendicis TaxID=163202 RepID=UPI00254BD5B4|nr:polyprenyl synthetase family protein [Corynebacterium appendicis]MDK8625383.1 polyprenyl synthetase family protein [Corynebacterium appendicis]